MGAVTVGSVAIALGAFSLPIDDTSVAPPGVSTASAAERAAAVLSAPPGSVVHEIAVYRQVAADGNASSWRTETWRQTSRPYARREITTRTDGARVETAIVGDRPAQLYDRATNTIYTNAPDAGPALGTPMPAADGDPMREQLADLLRSGRAREQQRSTADGRDVIRFAYRNPLPSGAAEHWTYLVDARTYEPIQLTATSPDRSRVTTRFETYRTLDATDDTTAQLSLQEQHPDAAVDRTETGYEAARSRLYSVPGPAGGG
ncbi:hypothetical protein [Solirubrobacter deserti]|uniref:MucB/RseB N-terminal domain-containing protein n=1 Tax=Solirubrobacter deserti TaxID=2282478 RepID=A0ABT4RQM6_9ACTN|nr:hypothetical protein [Solirubrobacter deserti]MDA0140873.1 hypothetical protein [Solirubrobacter deserti]